MLKVGSNSSGGGSKSRHYGEIRRLRCEVQYFHVLVSNGAEGLLKEKRICFTDRHGTRI